MKKYFILTIALIIIIVGCQNQDDLDKNLSEKVKTFEENNYLFGMLDITYEDFKDATEDIISNSFNYIDNKIIYSRIGKGVENVELKGIDLKGLPKEEFEKHKQNMYKMREEAGVNISDYSITIKVSKDYDEPEFNSEARKSVFSREIIESNNEDNKVNVVNRKYIFEKQDGTWKIINIISDYTRYSDSLLKERNLSKEEYLISQTRFDKIKNGEVEYILSFTLEEGK